MAKQVTIYSTPACGYCRMAKEFFKEENIEYTEYDVQADPSKAQEMIKKSGQMGVPVIVVSGEGSEEQMFVGFDRQALSEALGI
ncbi:MAG: glutaredoxin domain-containing protein [Patescibacteria group bacterium]|nr:glutaredoxin domain-containing protein [Patescibacteria group bacterium]